MSIEDYIETYYEDIKWDLIESLSNGDSHILNIYQVNTYVPYSTGSCLYDTDFDFPIEMIQRHAVDLWETDTFLPKEPIKE